MPTGTDAGTGEGATGMPPHVVGPEASAFESSFGDASGIAFSSVQHNDTDTGPEAWQVSLYPAFRFPLPASRFPVQGQERGFSFAHTRG